MSEKFYEALDRMGTSDLNIGLWGSLFIDLLRKTDGGEKDGSTTVYHPLDQNDPRDLLAFVGHYLDQFGVSGRLSLEGNILVLTPA